MPPMSLRFDFSTLADHLGAAIERAEADLRLEQAVYGIDAKDEKAIQALLAESLKSHYDVAREVHYPSTVGKKLTHRPRCDLVLTERGRPLKLDSTAPSLFDPTNQAPATDSTPPSCSSTRTRARSTARSSGSTSTAVPTLPTRSARTRATTPRMR